MSDGFFDYAIENNEATLIYCRFVKEHKRSITIPETIGKYLVTGIGTGAFLGNDDIESLVIPGTVKKIGDNAFKDCAKLESVVFGRGVPQLGTDVFAGCSSLSSVTLPKDITVLPKGMFAWCTALTKFVIPEGVTEIGKDVFYNCENLIDVQLPESLQKIGSFAFAGCRSLFELHVPAKVRSIGDNAFMQTSLEEIPFISDEVLMSLPVAGSKERMVNIADACPNVVINLDPESRQLQHLGEKECYVREDIAKRLNKVASFLPKHVHLMIWDGYRSLVAQGKMHERIRGEIKAQHPNWNDAQLNEETDKFIANPEKISLHATGGVVDLTLCDDNGKELNMGTEIDAFVPESATSSVHVDREARANRMMLVDAMQGADFVNYPPEWWHWSHGDSYWTATKDLPSIQYGYVERDLPEFAQAHGQLGKEQERER
jgi:D-alanyl-D-alanine dipeptidase